MGLGECSELAPGLSVVRSDHVSRHACWCWLDLLPHLVHGASEFIWLHRPPELLLQLLQILDHVFMHCYGKEWLLILKACYIIKTRPQLPIIACVPHNFKFGTRCGSYRVIHILLKNRSWLYNVTYTKISFYFTLFIHSDFTFFHWVLTDKNYAYWFSIIWIKFIIN
jgi:hypothetical protein